MSRILGVDPGTTESGWCLIESGKVLGSGVAKNVDVLYALPSRFGLGEFSKDVLAIEMVASYGMAVGATTFRTVWWAGRFAQAWMVAAGCLPMEVYRKDVKLNLCGTTKAKDANIRQSLIDMIGPQGKKSDPGPTYGVTSHGWAALAVAITAEHQLLQGASHARD